MTRLHNDCFEELEVDNDYIIHINIFILIELQC